MRHSLVLLVLAASCANPTIPDVVASQVAAVERPTRGVTGLCVAIQEEFARAGWLGVNDLGADEWQFALSSIVFERGDGLVVIDPSIGENVKADFARAGLFFSALGGDTRTKTPLVEVLRAAGLDPNDVRFALATHVHWDHIGAVPDLPNAKVLVSKPELESVQHQSVFVDTGVMPHSLAAVKDRLFMFPLDGPPREGFNSSFDVFGDGSVVALALFGHRPGHVGYWVTDTTGHHWFFIGDAAWRMRGVELPANKTVPIDSDPVQSAMTVGVLHAIFKNRPDVSIVPAHDRDALAKLPVCGRSK